MVQSSESNLELTIEKLVPEGKALGRLPDGRVVLTAGCVPGDRIAIEGAAHTSSCVKALGFRLLSASPLRIAPRCPVASQCGGCDWMMMDRGEQRRQKIALLADALARVGKLRNLKLPAGITSDDQRFGYRRRIRLRAHGDRIGFHARQSHDLVEPASCAVSTPGINAALDTLRQLSRAHPGALDAFDWLELREATDETISVYLARNERAATDASRSWLAALRQRFIVAASEAEAERRETWQRFALTPEIYMLSPPGTFTQVNWEVNQALIARVLAGARHRGAHSFFDAFSGAGNFSLPLLGAGLGGVAVEANRLAITAAREAAREQHLASDTFRAATTSAVARELKRRGQRFDLVLVDPPRAGVKSGLAELAALASGSLAMCSCNPVTLARDLRALVDLGFRIEGIECFDMFPETHHLETLVWLQAPDSSMKAPRPPFESRH